MTKTKSIRNRSSFAPQSQFGWKASNTEAINNLIHRTDVPEEKWIEETTENIGDWRDMSRTVYMRWAITINAMHVSSRHYANEQNQSLLRIYAFRALNGNPVDIALDEWDGATASKRYVEASEFIAAYGFTDMYGALEDIIFDGYEIFLRHNPLTLLKGSEYKSERRAYSKRLEKPDEWVAVWDDRFTKWRRKRLYDGLNRVARSYWTSANLAAPSNYDSDVLDWIDTIQMFSVLRNHITHSAPTVTEELAKACQIAGNMGFSFNVGDPLEVNLFHLQAIECFLDQYLTAWNMALIESAYGKGHWKKVMEANSSE